MSAPIVIPTPYATMHLCDACDVCGNFGCLDAHGLCDAVNPEQAQGCFREPNHDGLHTFEIGRAITTGERRAMSDPCRCHNNHAMITAWHAGHCCFFPASQTCHPEEVASWGTEEAERRKLLATNERNENP